MNLLQHALIEKAGHDNGFEHVLPSSPEGWLALGSARHPAEVSVQAQDGGFRAVLTCGQAGLPEEMARSFSDFIGGEAMSGPSFLLPSQAALAAWLRRTAALAELEPAAAMSTEVQRMVRQRVGQQAFRQAMLDYWGGACAVTGVALPQALRASHAKAWALCATDAERLDFYNGFLLSANLDALFDTGLATFDEDGVLHPAPVVTTLLAAVRIRCYSAVRARFAAEPVAGTNSGKRLADPDAEAAASPAAASERLVRVQ